MLVPPDAGSLKRAKRFVDRLTYRALVEHFVFRRGLSAPLVVGRQRLGQVAEVVWPLVRLLAKGRQPLACQALPLVRDLERTQPNSVGSAVEPREQDGALKSKVAPLRALSRLPTVGTLLRPELR